MDDKEYSPTILGFASLIFDKLGINFIPAGNNTWHTKPGNNEHTLTDLGGKPSTDTRTSAERNRDYLNSPYLRWKSSMLNGTNPLVGVSRTVIPAAEGALAITGILSIPQLVNLIKVAKSTPHGILNLAINAATLAATGTAGATVGNYVDKQLGGDGSIGSFAFGLGSLYGVNKIPFMKDFNLALERTTVSNGLMDAYVMSRGGLKYRYVEKSPGNGFIYDSGDDITAAFSPSTHAQLIHWKGDPTIEMHLGGNKEPLTVADLKWQRDNLKEVLSGAYLSPFSKATSRTLRISLNGVTKELLSKNNTSQAINRPPTVDGYKTAIKVGQHKGYTIDWSDNYYINGFKDYAIPKDTLFRSLYDIFLLNPSTSNLNNLNNYLIKIGGKPAKYINGELQIPFPIIYKQ